MKKFLYSNAVKSQIRGKNFWLLALIATLSITTILGLVNINTDVQDLAKAELKYNQQLLIELDQANDISAIQVEFKSQVQEWKDVLLRGHDPILYQKYWQQFEQSEAKVRAGLEKLHKELLTVDQDMQNQTQLNNSSFPSRRQQELNRLEQRPMGDLRFSDKVGVVLEGHILIGKIYREYLQRNSLQESANNAFAIDEHVRGIDRWLAEQLLNLRNQSVRNQESMTAQANTLQLQEIQELRLRIQRSIGAVALILIVNLLLLFDRLRSSNQELNNLTKKSEEVMYELAYTDSLTGLPNRRLFHDKLDHAIAVSGNSGQYSGLIFLDLDNFKTLNDTKGHAKGDLLLVEVAHRLRQNVRTTDTIARLGGDEFVVLLDALPGDAETAAEQAGLIAEKICVSLNQPYQLNSYTHHAGASIGVALFRRGEVSSEELLKRADTAMYQAKRAGRNTVRFYDQDTQNALEARSNLEHNLHSALLEQQLELYYQVQVDISGKPLGAEGLLRWHHPQLGLLYPTQFISLAEESDLIVSIGNWVLHAACQQLIRWESNPLTKDLVLSVNVSAAQLRQSKHVSSNNQFSSASRMHKPSFIEQVQFMLNKSGIDPSKLKLEITESLATQDIDYTIEMLQHLKSLGVSLSMDDFGTGHSSLKHLKRMPIDQIKIDQSFVQEIVTDNYDKAIVKSMIDMAHSLNIDILAEGVENKAQAQALVSQGCVSFQGHYYGRPISIKDFEAALQTHAGSQD